MFFPIPKFRSLFFLSFSLVTAIPSNPFPNPTTTTPIVPIQPIPTSIPPSIPHKLPVTRIFSSDGNGFENLHFRSNGHILATTAFPSALLFSVDPIHKKGILVHNFTSMSSTLGVTELAPDIFYVLGKSVNDTGFTIVEVDMNAFAVSDNAKTIRIPPSIKEVGRVREGVAMNGMTQLRRGDDFVLISDSLVGGVWKFCVKTGEYELVVRDTSMAGPANKTQFAAFGINGLRVWDGVLYYCNSGKQEFWKMMLHPNATSAAKPTLITSNIACDDFAIDPHHHNAAYVASPRNALIRLDIRTGKQLVVAGTFNESSSDILSASSTSFGAGGVSGGYRGNVGEWDRRSVYFTTNGGAFVGAPRGSQGIFRVEPGV